MCKRHMGNQFLTKPCLNLNQIIRYLWIPSLEQMQQKLGYILGHKPSLQHQSNLSLLIPGQCQREILIRVYSCACVTHSVTYCR